MPLPLPVYTDFKANLRLSLQSNTDDLTVFTEYMEKFYDVLMIEIIGNEAKEIIEVFDWTLPLQAPPIGPTPKWRDLVNGVSYFNIEKDRIVKLEGYQKIALSLLYWKFNSDYNILSNTGYGRNENENFNEALGSQVHSIVSQAYNEGIRLVNENLIPFLQNYEVVTGEITSIVDNAGTLTINTPNTIYLEEGDTVSINDIDYVISNLIDNVSYDITTGLIVADTYTYRPYEDVIFTYKDYTF